jgi:hypothetical protein
VGVYNIAVSGFGDFQLRDSAMKALKNKTAKQSLYQTIQIFGNKFKPLYEKEMLLVKIYRPNDYKFHLKNDLGSVAFFAFENGLPIGYQCFFQMKDINNNPVISFSIVKIDTMAIVGAYDHIDNISDQEFVPYRKAIETNLIEGLKKLIRLEINEHPREVACPLDVFRLTITGMTRERDDCNLN